MFAIPIKVDTKRCDVFVILEKENMDRISENDPLCVEWNKLSGYQSLLPRSIYVAYLSKEDCGTVLKLLADKKLQPALDVIFKGFAYHPEKGDNNGPYQRVLEN